MASGPSSRGVELTNWATFEKEYASRSLAEPDDVGCA